MLNGIFVSLVLISILLAAFTGGMEAVTRATVDSAKDAVELALKLVGVMAFFLGLMKVAEDGGLSRLIARAVSPLFRLLFPGVPRNHPAMSAMVLNISSNLLGLGNAATPFGIKAMMELNRLNARKGTATDAMVLFLAINTAGWAVVPSTVIAVRASMDSGDPAGILFPTFFASGCATAAGVTAAVLLSRLRWYRRTAPPVAPGGEGETSGGGDGPADEAPVPVPPPMAIPVAALFLVAMGGALVLHVYRSAATESPGGTLREILSFWTLPALVAGLVLFGWARGVKVYGSLVEGAKEGFQVAVRIIPYLVAVLVMVGMFRASGGMEWFVARIQGWTALLGLPAEALPMAVLRPFSGSGALAVMTEIMMASGPDSLVGYMVSTLQGSTETTFYVLAVYFGSVGVRKTRHALPACLMADVAGIAAAVFIVNTLFG